MNVSFAPLRIDAAEYLTTGIGIDYTQQWPFSNEDRWFCVTARDDEGGIMGVILAEFLNWFDVQFNTALTDPRCVTRRMLRTVFTALFSRAVRLTATIDVNNHAALRDITRMGFVFEGTARRIINGSRDAHLFGMLKEECRFLAAPARSTPIKELHHGWPAQIS